MVTGAAHGMDRKSFADQLPDEGATTLTDRTDEISTIGLWGPPGRDILSSLTSDDVDAGFGFLTCREITVQDGAGAGPPCWPRGSPTSASSAGSTTCPWTRRPRSGRPCSGRRPRRVPVGIGVYGTHRTDREGLPRLRLRARQRADDRRGRHAAAQGEAADFVGRRPTCSAGRPPPGALHAHRRRPRVGRRHERMLGGGRPDPLGEDGHRRHDGHHPRSRRPGPRRRSASTCCSPTCLPSRRCSAPSSPSRTCCTRHRPLRRRHRAARPGQRAHPR